MNPRTVEHYLRPGTLQLPALPPLSLYVHLPWCLKKCPYCDFATTKRAPGDIPHDDYADAIIKELGDCLWYIGAFATVLDLSMEEIAQRADVKLTHVAYKGGGTAMTDLIENPRILNWMRTTGETEFDGVEFRAWLRWAMEVSCLEGIGSVFRFDGDHQMHIGNHQEFDRFLDALPVDVGLSQADYQARLHASLMRLRDAS